MRYLIAILLWPFLRTYALIKKPDQLIGDRNDVYMRRWHLWKSKKRRWYLHNFKRSDDDRALHDHPWDSWSLCLGGRATEYVHGPYREHSDPVIKRRIYFGSYVFRKAIDAHAIMLDDGDECWTLFVTGPKIREWGFYCPRGWRHWKIFTGAEYGASGDRIGLGCGEYEDDT